MGHKKRKRRGQRGGGIGSVIGNLVKKGAKLALKAGKKRGQEALKEGSREVLKAGIQRGLSSLTGKAPGRMKSFLKDVQGTLVDVGVSAATGATDPMTLVATSVYGVLKAAGKAARRLEPDNLFRRMTVNHFGIPPSMENRMYETKRRSRTSVMKTEGQVRRQLERTRRAGERLRKRRQPMWDMRIAKMNADIKKYGRGSKELWKYGIYS